MKASLLMLLIIISSFIHHNSGSQDNYEDESNGLSGEALSGGVYAAIVRVPYQVQLCRGYSVQCGAVIISVNWLITAAHCCESRYISETKVITGSGSTCARPSPGTERIYAIERCTVHSEYNSKTLDYDIGLIKLNAPIKISNYQRPIKLAKKGPQPGVTMLISGYGTEGVNPVQAPILKIARIPVLQPRKCQLLYEKTRDRVPVTAFCAGGGVETACPGDSGGPGVVGGRLAGIVSAGRDCGSPNFPSMFTRVSLFRDWVEMHTGLTLE